MRSIYFPLRSSVELFRDPSSPEAVARAKQAVVLYDRVIFEAGLYDATFTQNGSSNWWTPAHQLTPDRLEHTRRPIPVGSPMTLAVAAQDGPGIPAKGRPRAVFSGAVSARYMAEFHTGILDELEQFNPEWLEVTSFGGTDNPARPGSAPHELIDELNRRDWRDTDLLREFDTFTRPWLYKTFNRDSVVATDFASSFSVTPLFLPLVERHGLVPELAGSEALDVLVPNLGSLPWEAVLEFREHQGSAEARAKLREFESRAAEQEPEDAYQFLKGVTREISDAYAAVINDLAPKLPEALAQEALLTLISVTSVIGPFVEKAVAVGQDVANASAFDRSWIAALMKLRQG